MNSNQPSSSWQSSRSSRCITSWMIAIAFTLLAPLSAIASDELFESEVAAIFARRCVSCHSGDSAKGDFSLENVDDLEASGYAIAYDDGASHLLNLITPVDGHAEMPKGSDPLIAEEVDAIARWIRSGAVWPEGRELGESRVDNFDWWSYRPIQKPKVPASEDDWLVNPIDAFILHTLKQNGLTPSAPADRRTLLRRVTFDLTGLPPTHEEIAAFVQDDDPRAYEQVVDRLLNSPQYGERWARHWLDVVMYADTCGYDKDKLRPNAWPYRDYVVRSFNDDKPYDRFIQEQIAGDVLFPGEPDGVLGLGFIAAGPWDFIGHAEVPESKLDGRVARNLDRDNMVTNAINTFCSVTVQCARCHHHKFDPITQQDYYGLQSIFAAVDRADRPYDLDPQVERERRELQQSLDQSRGELASLEKASRERGGSRLVELESEIAALQTSSKVHQEPQYGYHSNVALEPATTKWVEIDLGEMVTASQIVLRPCYDDFASIGAGFGFPVRFDVSVALDERREWVTIHDQIQTDFPNPGTQPVIVKQSDDPNHEARFRYVRVTATKLMKRANDYHFSLAEIEVTGANGENVAVGKPVSSLDSIEAPVRWGRSNLTDGRWPQPTDPDAAAKLARAKTEHASLVASIETPEFVAKRNELQSLIAATTKRLADFPQGRMVYAASTHFAGYGTFKPTEGALRPIHVLHRGDEKEPRELAVPSVLRLSESAPGQLDPALNEGERRAALARWLADREHPLVWRSIVNRVWQNHFGEGLVATPNDFGRMGALPTHPELLDWLAAEFRDNGQSFKSLHRLIVTSNTYKQASGEHPEYAKLDGNNRFLWRANRRRLAAEEVRDSILDVAGSLDDSMGGPGYYLFKIEKPEHSPHYQYHKFDPYDRSSHRRSIYRFIVRSQPDPWLSTLDCADSSQSTPKRNETLTPLQSLALLNNPFNLVMSSHFAERLRRESAELSDQVTLAIRLALQRSPTADEMREYTHYAERHGLENLCRVLFNLNEFVFVD